jgi:hypothetical protein
VCANGSLDITFNEQTGEKMLLGDSVQLSPFIFPGNLRERLGFEAQTTQDVDRLAGGNHVHYWDTIGHNIRPSSGQFERQPFSKGFNDVQ